MQALGLGLRVWGVRVSLVLSSVRSSPWGLGFGIGV